MVRFILMVLMLRVIVHGIEIMPKFLPYIVSINRNSLDSAVCSVSYFAIFSACGFLFILNRE